MNYSSPKKIAGTSTLNSPVFFSFLQIVVIGFLAPVFSGPGEEVTASNLAGRWYQAARLNNKMERELGNVEATFTERGDGNINFKFRGFKDHGRGSEVSLKGVAHPDSRNPTRVKVRFYGIFTRTYEILDYDRNNQEYVIIADDKKESLWLLCRKPVADDRLFDRMAELAVNSGLDAKRLCRTPQTSDFYAKNEDR